LIDVKKKQFWKKFAIFNTFSVLKEFTLTFFIFEQLHKKKDKSSTLSVIK
jgi:hypothetical protein